MSIEALKIVFTLRPQWFKTRGSLQSWVYTHFLPGRNLVAPILGTAGTAYAS